jgi:alginate production protein
MDTAVTPETAFRFPPAFTVGGRLELEPELQQNFDLEAAQDADVASVTPELRLDIAWAPSRYWQAFLRLELASELELAAGQERENASQQVALELAQAFLRFTEPADGRFTLQVGRQEFKDKREWLYDEELDALRVVYRGRRFELEGAVGRGAIIARDILNDAGVEPVNYYLLSGRYALSKQARLGAYGLVRDQNSAEQEHLLFLGLHAHGTLVKGFDHWFELAHVRGKAGTSRVQGWGLDVGATYTLALPLAPSLTVGYAFGSGDANPEDQADKSFRQTGLQDNEAKFHGVTSLKYYGELFDPELSNLMIFTGGVGLRPTRNSSLEFVYHLLPPAQDVNRAAQCGERGDPHWPQSRPGERNRSHCWMGTWPCRGVAGARLFHAGQGIWPRR